MTAFGPLLARSRAALGWSQTRLAYAVGCDTSMISIIEAGKRTPSLDLLHRICAALTLSPDDRAALFIAAGYPVLRESIALEARALHEFLCDESVPELHRARVRSWVSLTLAMHRAAGEREGAA